LVKGSCAEQLQSNRGNLKDCQRNLVQARKEIEQLRMDLSKSLSINLRLQKEFELLREK